MSIIKRQAYIHSIMIFMGMNEEEATKVFYSYYNENDIQDLDYLLKKIEREVTNDE